MKVSKLIELLQTFNQNAEVVIHRDPQNYGFGYIEKVLTGVFEITEYGNDFWPDQQLVVNPAQVRAICLFPEDFDQTKLVAEHKVQ